MVLINQLTQSHRTEVQSMPRVSKRNQNLVKEEIAILEKKLYKVGIYARLSSDHDKKKNESIDVQIDMAKKYLDDINAIGKEKLELFEIYTDCGKTGSNFSRDGFLNMMQDIRLGNVNCIIVKDFSRFGRNYLEAGNYIEKIFPFLGVRFIAVSDNFDTASADNDTKKMAMNIKNLVNDMYAKDFSKKAKIHLQQRRERGSYVGGPTPYGYTYEWEGRDKKLIVDVNTAPIVKLIFDEFIKTNVYAQVTDLLNISRINRPTDYKKTGEVYCNDRNTYKGWDKSSVIRILKSVTYIGILEQGRTSITARDEKNRTVNEKEHWVVHENAHPAIVSREVFQEAGRVIRKINEESGDRRQSKLIPIGENAYDDVLFCGTCGGKMTRLSRVVTYQSGENARVEGYKCNNAYNSKVVNNCESNRISWNILTDIVVAALKTEFALYLKKPKYFVEYNNEKGKKVKSRYENEINQVIRHIARNEELESERYIEYRSGAITQDNYVEAKLSGLKYRELQEAKKKELEESLKSLCKVIEKQNKAIRSLAKMKPGVNLTKEFINSLITKIYVYPGKRIEIIYAFTNEMMEGINIDE